MSFSVIIVDDEPYSHKVLQNHIGKLSQLQLKASFFNAADARAWLDSNKTDIILLDIKMPEISGLEFLRSLAEKPITIFITAFRDYALEGFELGVIDYLLKPVQFNRLELAINRAIDFLQLVNTANAIDSAEKTKDKNFEILIKEGNRKAVIDYRDISYAQGLKDYTILQTSKKKFVVKGSVKTMEKYLPADFFMRVHKSFIVAKNKIRLVHKNKIEMDEISIPVGRHFKEAVDQFLESKGSI
jgi:DNA-binding LytR/AlgR family response regulator